MRPIKVDINLNLSEYKPKLIIFFNHDYLIQNYTEAFLEKNKIFAICFDTTPLKNIHSMRDYKEVIDQFPDSFRVVGRAIYIGNYQKKDWEEIIKQTLNTLFGNNYEIFSREENYTILGDESK